MLKPLKNLSKQLEHGNAVIGEVLFFYMPYNIVRSVIAFYAANAKGYD